MRLTDREKNLLLLFAGVLIVALSYKNYRDTNRGADAEAFALKGESFEEANASEWSREEAIGGTIYVDIGGAVNEPGLYELDRGARVKDGVTAAGGVTGDADTAQINLAKKLNDEEKLYIPKIGENASPPESSSSHTQSGAVSIQNGSKEDLMRLPGIGEKTAEKIIEYRSTHPFTEIEDLKEVPGIGEKTFESLKSNIQL